MDILDEALDGSQGKDDSNSDDVQITQGPDDESSGLPPGTTLAIDPNNLHQYQFRTDQGGVTYRVVQVASGDGSDGHAQVAAFASGSQVIQSPFGGGSPNGDSEGNAQFTYFPTAGDVVTSQAGACGGPAQAGCE
ncbi:uncharacterized protein LOC127860909 [Dreissena polymorpha]|uniref:uncharacterized protein LOC127860909 n=1 Tax=Dreissena polymorpha TaxID=45954 RepID=UPI0022653028|nr:uncharacterized protein LOC127860909 [Dreissena polymorpha]